MAPSTKVKHRFQKSLDMVAVRSTYVDATRPSGTGNAWSMVDSPTLGRRANFFPRRNELVQGEASSNSSRPQLALHISPLQPKTDTSTLVIKKENTLTEDSSSGGSPQVSLPISPEVKRIRRRGLTTNVKLILPPSPLPPRSPSIVSSNPANTPQTGLTFTAEWDLHGSTFVFTPFENSYPLSPVSPVAEVSPIPDDVLSEVITTAETPPGDDADAKNPPPSPSSSVSSASRYSVIFDSPNSPSIYSQDRRASVASTSTPLSTLEMTFTPHESSFPPLLPSRDRHVQLFEEELYRSLPGKPESHLNKFCYEEMDEDLLSSPMDALTQMFWERTDQHSFLPCELAEDSHEFSEESQATPIDVQLSSNFSSESLSQSHEEVTAPDSSLRNRSPPQSSDPLHKRVIPPPMLPLKRSLSSSLIRKKSRRIRNLSDDLVNRLQLFIG